MTTEERATKQAEIKLVKKEAQRLKDTALREGRNLSAKEKELLEEANDFIEKGLRELGDVAVARAVTVPMNGPLSVGAGYSQGAEKFNPFTLRSPRDGKDYDALFGQGGYRWQDKDASFFSAVFSGRFHPGLVQNASMTETVPSDGGFLVPVETARKIHNVALESELVMPRAYVQPMASSECKVPAMSIGDHSTALMGGFVASYTAELGTISEANPKARSMTLTAKKLTGLVRMSNELAADAIGGEQQIISLCGKGLGWYRDRAFLKGTGAGEPLGILNADCLVTVEKESGQAASTVTYENLTKMLGRMFAGSFNNSAWICHQTLIPQLLQLSIAVGTGGSHIPVMRETDGKFTMLTRPVIFTEKTEPLGTKGDIMLCDFSQYVVGLRQDMRFDTSIHVGFSTDELLARIIERHDGQPLWDEPLTLLDGSTTVSPFVCLAARE